MLIVPARYPMAAARTGDGGREPDYAGAMPISLPPLPEAVTPAVARGLARWEAAIARHDEAALPTMIAAEAVFRSPAVHTPQVGRETVATYLGAAFTVLGPTLTYHSVWTGTSDAVLRFSAELDGLHLDGVDMITWDDDGVITDFTVMIRPLKALNAVVAAMGHELGRRLAEPRH